MWNILKISLLLICFQGKAQTFIIDNLKVVNSKDSIIKQVDTNIKIVFKDEYLKFYLDGILYQTYKTTKPSSIKGITKFICWDKSYELQFIEVTDRNIYEKFIGYSKVYHIKQIFK